MAPDCDCERFVDRRSLGKKPLHLKAYDDSNGPELLANDETPVFSHHGFDDLHEYAPATSKIPDCSCLRCLQRSRNRPVHLKVLDDTVNTPWCCICVTDCKISTCSAECNCTRCGYDESRRRRSNSDFAILMASAILRRRSPSLFGFESAYTKCRTAAMIHGRVDYDKCTPKDLKMFLKQRFLHDPYPPGLTLKSTYIRILNAADRIYTFRFLDLPPEMQNLVYSKLLIMLPAHDRKRKHCFPQILSTCREVSNDATGILYSENDIDCKFSVTYYKNDGESKIKLHNDVVMCDTFWNKFASSFFHNLTSITIYVHVGKAHDSRTSPYEYMPNTLLAFASSLMDNHVLAKVKIEISDGCDDEDGTFGDLDAACILYPLRRLRGISKVEVMGNVSTDLARSIQDDMESVKLASNTLWRQQSLKLQGQAYLEYYYSQISEPEFRRTYVEDSFEHQIINKLDELKDMPYNDEYRLYRNESHEAEVQQTLDELETMLKDIPKGDYLYGQDTEKERERLKAYL